MLKNILFLVFIINCLGTYAQNFERLFLNHFDSYATDVLQIGNAYYISCNNVSDNSNNIENIKSEIYKLDSDGNLVNIINFNFLNNHVKINRLINVNNDIFIYGINSVDASSFNQKAFIARIDTNLNIKYLQNYFTENVAYSFMYVTEFDSTNFLSYYLPGYPYYISLINKNNGSVELKKLRADFPFYSLVYLKNKNLIHLYTFNQFSFPIISLDDINFDIIDSIYYQSLNYSKKSNLQINDSTYIIASEYLKNTPNNPDAHWDLSIIKVNHELNNIEDIVYNSFPATLSHVGATTSAFAFCKSDSNIIYYGGTYNYTVPIPSDFVQQKRRFELLKIDRQGHFVDRKIFSNNNESYSVVMNSLYATNDGGCIMVGSYWDYGGPSPEQKRGVYVLKVDSLGNFSPSLHINKSNDIERNIYLFPNPNTDRTLNFKGFNIGDRIILYSIQGQLINNIPIEDRINLSDLSNGIYLYSILSKEGEIIKKDKLILY